MNLTLSKRIWVLIISQGLLKHVQVLLSFITVHLHVSPELELSFVLNFELSKLVDCSIFGEVVGYC